MKRPSASMGIGAGVVAAAGAAMLVIGQVELSGQTHPDVWSNAWMVSGVVVLGLVVLAALIFVVTEVFNAGVGGRDTATLESAPGSGFSATMTEALSTMASSASVEDDASRASAVLEPPYPAAFTESWRHTADGFAASPLMNMVNTAMPGHLGSPDREPFVRVGVCVACEPVPSDASSSQMGARFIEFLSRDPVAELVSAVTDSGADIGWQRRAGNGTLRFDAVMGGRDEGARPPASAMLLPPAKGLRLHRRSDDIACLWLQIDPMLEDGSPAPPATLAAWHERIVQAVSVGSALADFLAKNRVLATRDDPAARVGLMLQTPGTMTALVDTGELRVLPGAIQSNQFLGYAIADPAGVSAQNVARDLLRQLCDRTLHLDGFEEVLASIGTHSGRTTRAQAPAVRDTWQERDLPVLTAVVKLLEAPGAFMVTVSEVAAETGIDKNQVDRALEALKSSYYISKYQRTLSAGDPSNWYVTGVTSAARRRVGQWPDR